MKGLLFRYSQKHKNPSRTISILVRILVSLPLINRSRRILLFRRFLEATSLPINVNLYGVETDLPALEILFVCAERDFELLQEAMNYAIAATDLHEVLCITLVVPDSDLEQARNLKVLTNTPIKVISENSMLTAEHVSLLKERFDNRSGWVIQQLLKILYVTKSKAPGVLVCDADTMLTTRRVWFDANQNQILTPSWEYKKSYYRFLSQYNLVGLRPKYTFVAHHMLMQPRFMKEAREYMGWGAIDKILHDLTCSYDGIDESPFSIDYELYAQFLLKQYPDKIVLSKWANMSFSRTDFNLKDCNKLDFSSISLHHYL